MGSLITMTSVSTARRAQHEQTSWGTHSTFQETNQGKSNERSYWSSRSFWALKSSLKAPLYFSECVCVCSACWVMLAGWIAVHIVSTELALCPRGLSDSHMAAWFCRSVCAVIGRAKLLNGGFRVLAWLQSSFSFFFFVNYISWWQRVTSQVAKMWHMWC